MKRLLTKPTRRSLHRQGPTDSETCYSQNQNNINNVMSSFTSETDMKKATRPERDWTHLRGRTPRDEDVCAPQTFIMDRVQVGCVASCRDPGCFCLGVMANQPALHRVRRRVRSRPRSAVGLIRIGTLKMINQLHNFFIRRALAGLQPVLGQEGMGQVGAVSDRDLGVGEVPDQAGSSAGSSSSPSIADHHGTRASHGRPLSALAADPTR